MKESNTEIKSKNTISLDFAIEDYFCIAKNVKNFSDATISSYAIDFKQFKNFLERNGDSGNDIAAITPVQIEEFCMVLIKERGISINSVHRKKDAFSSLLRHAEKRGWIDKNPVARVELARKKKNARQVFLNRQQIKEFITADVRIKGYAVPILRAVRLALCFTGIRNLELRKFNWENVDFHKNIRFNADFCGTLINP